MNRVIKVPAVEGGNFTAQNNRVNFKLSSGPNYDLRNAYLNLYTSVDNALSETEFPNAICNFIWKYGGANGEILLENEAFIKNANMRTTRKGYLEDLREIGKFKNTLSRYKMSSSEYSGNMYNNVFQEEDELTTLRGNIHREFTKEGNKPSRNLTTPIRIPLKNIFNVANTPFLPSDKLGDIDVHFELDLENITPEKLTHLVPKNKITGDPPVDTPYDCEDILTADAHNTLVFKDTETFDSIKHSPFWVGQLIEITFIEGGNNYVSNEVIKSITYNANKTLTIVIDRNLLAGDLTEVKVKPDNEDITGFKANYEYAELVVEELTKPPQEMPNVLQYTTITTEEHTTGEVNKLQKIFQCEPMAVNLFVLLNDTKFLPIIESDGKYRISVDNNMLTNRDVYFNTSLHFDLINKTFLNAGMKLNNLSKDKHLHVMMAPLPEKLGEKQVQINVELTTDTKNFKLITLYKQVIKEIQL